MLKPHWGQQGTNATGQQPASLASQLGLLCARSRRRLLSSNTQASKRRLLTLLIPLFSLARLPAPLPGGGPEPANYTSDLQCGSPSPGLSFSGVVLGAAGPCPAVQDRVVSCSTPCHFPFTISRQIILILDGLPYSQLTLIWGLTRD